MVKITTLVLYYLGGAAHSTQVTTGPNIDPIVRTGLTIITSRCLWDIGRADAYTTKRTRLDMVSVGGARVPSYLVNRHGFVLYTHKYIRYIYICNVVYHRVGNITESAKFS